MAEITAADRELLRDPLRDPIATDCCQGTVCAALPTGGFACAAPGT